MKFSSISNTDLNETLFKHSYANKLMEKQYNDIKKQTLLKYLVQIEFMERIQFY
jgi:hypothetical protein